MKKYIVISPHTAEDCRLAVNQFREYNAGFLTHFQWGCKDNDHTAYAMIEADNHASAKLSVPTLFREKTRVVMLTTFDPAKKDELHNEK
jgi:hypothetical protein